MVLNFILPHSVCKKHACQITNKYFELNLNFIYKVKFNASNKILTYQDLTYFYESKFHILWRIYILNTLTYLDLMYFEIYRFNFLLKDISFKSLPDHNLSVLSVIPIKFIIVKFSLQAFSLRRTWKSLSPDEYIWSHGQIIAFIKSFAS